MRPARSILGLLLALGSAAALLWLDHPAATPNAVASCKRALRQDPATPYRWADLAEALFAAGDTPGARLCFARARQLGPHIPPIWVRDANFHIQLGEPAAALASSARVLEIVPDYDAVLFTSFDRLTSDPNQVLAQIGSNKRATISWFRHLINVDSVSAAESTWQYLLKKDFANDELAADYISFLLRSHLYNDALRSWTAYLGPRRGDYPDRNLLFNGNFESAPTGSPLDWRVQSSDKVDTIRDKTGIHITFHGDNNIAYDHVRQTARVHPGPHRLCARIRTQDITTVEGVRLCIIDPESPARLDFKTTPVSGTHPWTLIDEPIRVPQGTEIVTVEICRLPSTKFDNKIAGEAWVDSVSLTRAEE